MINTFSKTRCSLICLALALGLAGCNNANSPESPTENGAASKLQAFVACLNRADKSLLDKGPKYQQLFKTVAASPGKDHNLAPFNSFKIEPYETNNSFSRDCIDVLSKAVEQNPADPVLDEIGRDYAKTLESMIPVMNEIDNYYAQQDYRDDKMEKGKALDSQIMPLLVHLSELSGKMRQEVDVRQDQLADARLADIEKAEGKEFTWQTENVMLQARRTLTSIDHAFSGKKPDLGKLNESEAQMQKAFDSALAYGKANPDVKTKLGNQPLWFHLQANAQNYLQAIKTLRRDAAENKRDLSEDMRKLGEAYNRLVQNYNLRARLQ